MDPQIGFINLNNHYEISGTGFGVTGNSNTVIKFWRNNAITTGAANTQAYVSSDTLLLVMYLPSGTTSGRLSVITPNGQAMSPFIFTP